MLEGVLRHQLGQREAASGWRVDSAGTGNWHQGEPPDPRAVACLAARGIDIADLRARTVLPEDFCRFDLMLCADRSNLRELQRRRPAEGLAELALALDWAGVVRGGEIPDPYFGGCEGFEHVADLAGQVATALLDRLAGRA